MADHPKNSVSMYYPLTKMSFVVSLLDGVGDAAFSEVTGIEASVDVIEFRQGNANSLAPVKLPGLVKNGNITLKMGYIRNSAFKTWVQNCVTDARKGGDTTGFTRHDLAIELIDIATDGVPTPEPRDSADATAGKTTWVLRDAWVCKYVGPDLNSTTSDVAVESIEIAYERLEIPN